MIFCFDNASLTDVESIQVPRSKMGGGGPKSGGAILKSSSLGLTQQTQGHFNKFLKNEYGTFKNKGAMKEKLFKSAQTVY